MYISILLCFCMRNSPEDAAHWTTASAGTPHVPLDWPCLLASGTSSSSSRLACFGSISRFYRVAKLAPWYHSLAQAHCGSLGGLQGLLATPVLGSFHTPTRVLVAPCSCLLAALLLLHSVALIPKKQLSRTTDYSETCGAATSPSL